MTFRRCQYCAHENMECKLDSPCSELSRCDGLEVDKAVSDLWIDINTVKSGILAVFFYLICRLLQDLLRWPASFIFSLTGLSFLWSLLVHVARGLLVMLKWSTHIWSFVAALLSMFSKISWVPDAFRSVAGSFINVKQYCEGLSKRTASISEHLSLTPTLRPHVRDPGLRVIVLGPSRGMCGTLRDSLLGYSAGALAPDIESTTWRAKVDGREVTVVETPDLFGTSLSVKLQAQEALRSLQLTSPGPHALLLVLPTTYLDKVYQNSAQSFFLRLLHLLGEEAAKYVLVVFTCVNLRGGFSSLEQLLEEDYLGIKAALPLCGDRVDLVNISPGRSIESRMVEGRRLLDRVANMRTQQGHFIHEFQQQEDQIRTELLNDMTLQIEQKLEGLKK